MSDQSIIDVEFVVVSAPKCYTRLPKVIKRAWQPLAGSLATLIAILAIQAWSIPSWLTWQFVTFEAVVCSVLLVVLLAIRDINRRRNYAQKRLNFRRQFTSGNYNNRRTMR
jgi:hypothetical protein